MSCGTDGGLGLVADVGREHLLHVLHKIFHLVDEMRSQNTRGCANQAARLVCKLGRQETDHCVDQSAELVHCGRRDARRD